MIIDLILDRKDGVEYDPREFYNEVMGYRDTFPELADPITMAMDEGNEEDVRNALKDYIDKAGYPAKLKDYIDSEDWLEYGWIVMMDYSTGGLYKIRARSDMSDNEEEELIKSKGLDPIVCSWMFTKDDEIEELR